MQSSPHPLLGTTSSSSSASLLWPPYLPIPVFCFSIYSFPILTSFPFPFFSSIFIMFGPPHSSDLPFLFCQSINYALHFISQTFFLLAIAFRSPSSFPLGWAASSNALTRVLLTNRFVIFGTSMGLSLMPHRPAPAVGHAAVEMANNFPLNQQQQQTHSPSVDTLQVQPETGGAGGNGSSNGKQQRRRKKENATADEQTAEGQQQQLNPRQNVQRLPPGVLYIYEGRLVYRSRRWSRLPWPTRGGGQPQELTVELCQIGDVNVAQQFFSQRDNKPVRCRGPLVDVLVTGRQPPLHLGFLTAQAEAVGQELREIFLRHRHRPRIFQFNSIDVDGIEIDVP